MFINIIQISDDMNILELRSKLFSGLFSMIHKDSRGDEDKEVQKDAVKEINLTIRVKRDEKEEKKTLKKLVIELKEIDDGLTKQVRKFKIPGGKFRKGTTVERALFVLIKTLSNLIDTSTSVKEEEATLINIETYWRVLRTGLRDPKVLKDVGKVDILFKRLEIELNDEDKADQEMIELTRNQNKILLAEDRGSTKKPQPARVGV